MTKLENRSSAEAPVAGERRPGALSSWPQYSEEEIESVARVLRTGKVNYWTGTEVRSFESEFADYHGVRHGIALANGTVALELALIALGIGPGDQVIVTPRSFFASASCIVRVGAEPVFVDVDRDSQNITAESIASGISDRTKGVIVVHLAGWPCEMRAICELAREHDLKVIEDCAQAHGAKIGERFVGSFGDAAAFSFCQDKIMSTAGEGGMLLTNSDKLSDAAWAFKDHGKNKEKVFGRDHPPGFRWLHDSFGTNWRLTEIQGAIGRSQLRKLETWVAARNENAARVIAALEGFHSIRIPVPEPDIRHAYYKLYFFVQAGQLRTGWTRDRILAELEARGCPGYSGSCPEIYREAAFKDRHIERLAVSRELGETSIMLPVHPTLRQSDVDFMIDSVSDVLDHASR